MRRLTLPSVLLLAAICLSPSRGYAEDTAAPPKKPKKPKLEQVYFSIQGTIKEPAATAATRSVESVAGVRSLTWTSPRQEAKIVRVVGKASTPDLVAAFSRAGVKATRLPVTQTKLVFKKNLHCNGCVIKVRRALKAVKGTKEIRVADDKASVTVLHDTKRTTVASLQKALSGVGYPATPTAR